MTFVDQNQYYLDMYKIVLQQYSWKPNWKHKSKMVNNNDCRHSKIAFSRSDRDKLTVLLQSSRTDMTNFYPSLSLIPTDL